MFCFPMRHVLVQYLGNNMIYVRPIGHTRFNDVISSNLRLFDHIIAVVGYLNMISHVTICLTSVTILSLLCDFLMWSLATKNCESLQPQIA